MVSTRSFIDRKNPNCKYVVSSLFVYKLNCIALLNKEFIQLYNTKVKNFVWDNKKAKIPLKVLQAGKKDGALGLANIELRDKSLKGQWGFRIQKNDLLKNLAYELLGNPLGDLLWEATLEEKDLKNLFAKARDTFWYDVLLVWYEIFSQKIETVEQVKKQVIWYNSAIRINNTPVWFKKWSEMGLNRIADIINNDGRLFTLEQIKIKYGFEPPFTEYYSIAKAIPEEWKRQLRMQETQDMDNLIQQWSNVKSQSKLIYFHLNQRQDVLTNMVLKWNQTVPSLTLQELLKYIKNIYSITNTPKLRSFQYRLLQKAIITNIQLVRYGIKDSALCTFCEAEVETVKHLFYECQIIGSFWEKIIRWLNLREPLTWEIILFNNVLPNPKHLPNLIVLLAKRYIYVNRCLQKEIVFDSFKALIQDQKNIELFIAKKNNKTQQHNVKWSFIDSE